MIWAPDMLKSHSMVLKTRILV